MNLFTKIDQQVLPVDNPLPVFIVGAGGIVRDAHLPAYRKAGYSILGICDLIHARAENLRADFPEIQNVYTSLEAFLASHPHAQVVYDIAVPPDQIPEVVEKLPHGAFVLIQKPMGEDLVAARNILDICTRKSFAAGINFQLRYAPFSLTARHLIAQGLLGEIYDVEVMVCVFTPWHLWDFLKEKSRVEILYHSIHYIDLIRAFLGTPAKVYASTIKHPKIREIASSRTTMILDYDAFTQARIITNHGHDFGPREQSSYLKIEGTKGAIKVQIGVSLDYPRGKPDRMWFTSAEATGGIWEEIGLQGSWFPDAFVGTMAHVQQLQAVKGEDRFRMIRDNFATMRVVEAAYRSSESGGIRLSEVQ